ncbi:AEC family transporter [Garciella nitratireducens]|uniref:Uncharacterized protein n=1 Tax=Garciella nitratireducens DSM 15102 TaxID=1121911 RepID=A0A1T4NXW1_9FIRM|nr:AEC family transporter [Garciella nitratireducens]SJZ84083.1 hypothetical protein SAMN02745973_01855 [Garciella nitratireducens DSM 15102]
MLEAFGSVASIFIMIGIGYLLARKKVLNEETNQLFSKIFINVSLPLSIIASLPDRFTLDELMGSSVGILAAFLIILIAYFLSYIMARIVKIRDKERAIFCATSSFGNILFIGLPVCTSIYGQEATGYVLLYYIANTTLFWTIGVYNIRKYSKDHEEINVLESIKNVFSPPLMGFLIGVGLIVLKIDLPYFIKDAFRHIGNLATPMSMLFIGTVIYNINFKKIKLNLIIIMNLLGKFLLTPLVAITVLSFFSLPKTLNSVFILQAAGPIISQFALVAERYDVNSKYAAFMVGLSTIFYMFVVPIYMFFIG